MSVVRSPGGASLQSSPTSGRSDTYTTTASGTTIALPFLATTFALLVTTTGVLSAWDIRLEGSIDGTNFTQVLQHTNTDGAGVTKWTGASLYPCTHIRSRCAGLTLGLGTNAIVSILASD